MDPVDGPISSGCDPASSEKSIHWEISTRCLWMRSSIQSLLISIKTILLCCWIGLISRIPRCDAMHHTTAASTGTWHCHSELCHNWMLWNQLVKKTKKLWLRFRVKLLHSIRRDRGTRFDEGGRHEAIPTQDSSYLTTLKPTVTLKRYRSDASQSIRRLPARGCGSNGDMHVICVVSIYLFVDCLIVDIQYMQQQNN